MACTQDSPNQKGSISECYLSEIMAKTKALITCVVTAQLTSLYNRYPRFAPNILWLKRGKSGVSIKTIIKFPFKRKACQVYEGGCCRQVSTVVSLVVW